MNGIVNTLIVREIKVLGLKKNYSFPANNAMQGPRGPCKGCPYGNRTNLAAGAAVAPHGFTARVSCYLNYLC